MDLGAGTGARTRLLVGRADEAVGVEPDDRMRAVLAEAVPGVLRWPDGARRFRFPTPGANRCAGIVLMALDRHGPTLERSLGGWSWAARLPRAARAPTPTRVSSREAQALLRGDGEGGGEGEGATGMGIDEQSQADLSVGDE